MAFYGCTLKSYQENCQLPFSYFMYHKDIIHRYSDVGDGLYFMTQRSFDEFVLRIAVMTCEFWS